MLGRGTVSVCSRRICLSSSQVARMSLAAVWVFVFRDVRDSSCRKVLFLLFQNQDQ
jgi:hypothetical protein